MIYLIFLFVILLILLFAFYQWQYFMIFTPVYYRKEGICEKCEYLSSVTSDGIELEGVVYEPTNPKATLLFFGGRSDDSVALVNKLAQHYKEVRIVSFNYRSYGRSQGVANEENLFQDGLHVAHLIQKHYGDFYTLGFSLGSSVATYVASQHPTKALFLLGAFDSIASLVKQKYKISLPSWLIRYKFETQHYIQKVKAPVCLFASKNDAITYIENTHYLKNYIVNLLCYEEFEGLAHKELLCYDKVVQKVKKVIYEKEDI